MAILRSRKNTKSPAVDRTKGINGDKILKNDETDNSSNEEFTAVDKKSSSGMMMRLLYGIPLMIFVLYIIYLGHHALALLIFLVQTAVFRELLNVRYKEAVEREVPWFRTIHYSIYVVSVLYIQGHSIVDAASWYLPQSEVIFETVTYLSTILYASVFMWFVLSLKKGLYKYQFGQIAWTMFSVVFIVAQSNAIFINIYNGLIWFMLPVSLVICNDSFAYFCGKAFGKKFFQSTFLELSPNKTWEGFIGAAFITVIFSFFWSRLLSTSSHLTCPFRMHPDCNEDSLFVPFPHTLPQWISLTTGVHTISISPIQFHAVYLAVFASIVAPFGGFFASGIKRAFGLKDFDNLIPGHGGLMDRVDCQFIMALYTLAHYQTFVKYDNINPVQSLISKAMRLSPEDQNILFNKVESMIGSSI